MKTVNVALKPGQSPRDVEGFPGFVSLPSTDPAWKVVKEGDPPPRRDFERSCDGALYLSESYKPITTDELLFIQSTLPDLYANLFMHDESGWLGAQAPVGSVAASIAAGATQNPPAAVPVTQTQPVVLATPEPTKAPKQK